MHDVRMHIGICANISINLLSQIMVFGKKVRDEMIKVDNLNKSFTPGERVLDNISFAINEGEMVALIGASGSGKSTLIRHIAGLVKSDADSGIISVRDETMQAKGRLARNVRKVRADIGVVFQQFNLVNRLSVLTNVLLGLLGQIPRWRGNLGVFTHAEKRRAMHALQRVGIDRFASQRASTLSGGQQQRAAIARAITQGAKIILADEPIASLDPVSSRKVMENLKHLNAEDGVTILVSLHQVEYATTYCPRTIAMREGRVIYDGPSDALTPDFLRTLYGDVAAEISLQDDDLNQKSQTQNQQPQSDPAPVYA